MPTDAEIARAVEVLRSGGLVAFPTETVYGLGADACSVTALRRLYAVKGRPPDHPVIVHLASAAQLPDWAAEVPECAGTLARACWPGPLTLVLARARGVPDEATGGLATVAVRVPDQPVALSLLRAFAEESGSGGVAAPSANRFGRVSPTTALDVRADLGDDVDLVLDGGPCRIGVESTIVDCTTREPTILRLGAVAREQIEVLLGRDVPVRGDGTVRAPGTLASHYAPHARVVVVDAAELTTRARTELNEGGRVGVVTPELPNDLPAGALVVGVPLDVDDYARSLYQLLRDADAHELDILLAVAPPDVGLGAAVGDRLRRAAGVPR